MTKRQMPVGVRRDCCCICQKMEDLELHHISHHPELLIPLCLNCHYKVHHQKGYFDHLQPEMSRSDSAFVKLEARRRAIRFILEEQLERVDKHTIRHKDNIEPIGDC